MTRIYHGPESIHESAEGTNLPTPDGVRFLDEEPTAKKRFFSLLRRAEVIIEAPFTKGREMGEAVGSVATQAAIGSVAPPRTRH